jgi:hypothetical protein
MEGRGWLDYVRGGNVDVSEGCVCDYDIESGVSQHSSMAIPA